MSGAGQINVLRVMRYYYRMARKRRAGQLQTMVEERMPKRICHAKANRITEKRRLQKIRREYIVD